jgi:hypothetical protein
MKTIRYWKERLIEDHLERNPHVAPQDAGWHAAKMFALIIAVMLTPPFIVGLVEYVLYY